MREMKSSSWGRCWRAAIVLAVLASAIAGAQQPSNVIIACQGGASCPTNSSDAPYTDLQDAIDAAEARADALGEQVLLLVVGGPWPGPFTINADANVHMLGLTLNANQVITVVNPGATATDGTFTLSFTDPADANNTATTAALDWDATAAEVQAALEALATIGVGNVAVTGNDGGPFTVVFQGALADTHVPLIVADDTNLTPSEAFVLVQSNDGPYNIILQGTGTGPTLTIDGSTTPTDISNRDGGVERGRLIIEGVSIRGGEQGVRINGGNTTAGLSVDDPILPTLNRCYIIDNDTGVLVEGIANPLLVNSSISANDAEGVRVAGLAADGTEADILHCSIINNVGNGVFVAAANNARVRNTLVYTNGSGTGQGGLVWEDNPFIDPDSGPLDGIDPGTGVAMKVTINGTNLDDGTNSTRVFFGPPSKAGTEATVTTFSSTQLIVDLPPSAYGVPGPVDVYIIRGDNFEIRVPNGFTYTSELLGADPIPVVTQVDPGWGPANNSTYDVYVYGYQFDKNCSVFFDWDGGADADTAEQSPRVLWLSSSKLFVRVPAHAATGRIDVLVRNNLSGRVSPPAGGLPDPVKDFEYRTMAVPPPQVSAIIPSSISTVGGSGTSTNPGLLPNILGADFVTGAVVRIGGVVCSYEFMDAGGGAIRNVHVPVSEFGAGGVYDVEVTNPDGQSDVLPNGFTYFPSAVPDGDPATAVGDNEWRVSNFVERGVALSRDFYGHDLDERVDVVATTLPATIAPNVQPIAQRIVANISFPPDTAGLTGANGATTVPIEVRNIGTELGNGSAADFATTNMYYAEPRTTAAAAGQATYFQINSATVAPGTPDVITLNVVNADAAMRVFVGQHQIAAPVITPPGALGGVGTIVFDAPTPDDGEFGPVDIRVDLLPSNGINLTGDTLYYVLADGYSFHRTQEPPQVDAVTPATVPDDGSVEVRVTGSNFIRPMDVTAAAPDQLFTRLVLTWNNGNSVTIAPGAAGVTAYNVVSYHEIRFTLNLSVVPFVAVDNLADFPRGEAVDVRAEQVQGATVLQDTNGVNLAATLPDALTFTNTLPLQITPPLNPSFGPVSGQVVINNPIPGANVPVLITGVGFTADGGVPRVLFGTSEAVVNTATLTDTNIEVALPPAPDGKPGVYDVTVIRGTDHRQVTAVKAFTYYMDGRPTVTRLTPNHTFFDPVNPPATASTIFVTISGYNFDDNVRITFTDATTPADTILFDPSNNPTRYRVLSPNEIVVQLSTDDFPGVLVAGDYTTDLAQLDVTVQNDPTLTVGSPEALALTSDPPVPFFVYSDTRGDVIPELPDLLYNDVYLNNQDDYVNVAPGAGSISIEPAITGDTPWLGKLVPDPIAAPLLSTAGPFTEDPYTVTDFELDPRPQGDGAEIGADEISDITLQGDCSWYFARVTPSPVGQAAVRQLLVEVRYTGDCGVPFIVPQGVIDPSVSTNRIPLELLQTLGNGDYLYTNSEQITTFLPNDVVADGHAAVVMYNSRLSSNQYIGFIPNQVDQSQPNALVGRISLVPGVNMDRITSQAVYGRHFLIDTVPPRMYIEGYGVNGFLNSVTGQNLIVASNDGATAHPVNVAPATHPVYGFPPLATPYRPSDNTAPPFTDWPVDDGAIRFKGLVTPTFDSGSQIFFNVGSESNPDATTVTGGERLDTTVRVIFYDPPVTQPTDPLQAEVIGIDYFTGETHRQVAGFPMLGAALTIDEAASVNPPASSNILLDPTLIVRWRNDSTLNLTNGIAKQAIFGPTTGVGTNLGVFDPARAGGDAVVAPTATVDQQNNLITAQWSLADMAPVASQTFRLRAQFIGQDLSDNETTDSDQATYKTLFDPLQMWWMYDVASQLSGPGSCDEPVNQPFFNVSLVGQRPSILGEPRPVFTYHVWVSNACDGVYIDSGLGWSDWDSSNYIDLLSDFSTLTPAQQANLQNQYLLVGVFGADEAGNVEDWPLGLFPDPANIDLSTVTELPRNFKRFFFTNETAPETNVGLEIWYDLDGDGDISAGEPVFGDSPIIPMPADPFVLRARYKLSVELPQNVAAGNIEWSFQEDGVTKVQSPLAPPVGAFSSNSDVIPIQAPGQITAGNPNGYIQVTNNFLGDPNRQRPVTYLFTAKAVYVGALGAVYDPTPASAYFVVVPAGVSDFVAPQEDVNKQPIKEQGAE